jgi:hypothetical protein
MASFAAPEDQTVRVVPWTDPVIDELGLDPRSAYVETFWLGILGPSTTWLMRRFATLLDEEPRGVTLDLGEEARRLGVGHREGRRSPFVRALGRCVTFELARAQGRGILGVRRRMPPLNRRQILHLPGTLQESHRRWQESQLRQAVGTQLQWRVRELALRQDGRGGSDGSDVSGSDGARPSHRSLRPVPG